LSNKSGLINQRIQTTTWRWQLLISLSAAEQCAGRGCALIRQLANGAASALLHMSNCSPNLKLCCSE